MIDVPSVLDDPSYIINMEHGVRLVIANDIGFGLALLLIPVFGLQAYIWFTRYQLIQAAFTILVITLIGILVVSGIYVCHFCVLIH